MVVTKEAWKPITRSIRMLASNPLAELNPRDSDGDAVVALDEEEAEAMAASIANRHPETAA